MYEKNALGVVAHVCIGKVNYLVGALVLEVFGDLVLALEGRAVELAAHVLLGELAHLELFGRRPRAGVVLVAARGWLPSVRACVRPEGSGWRMGVSESGPTKKAAKQRSATMRTETPGSRYM